MTTATKNRLPRNRNGQSETEPPTTALFDLKRLSIKVVGVTPLLCANPASMQPDSDGATRGKRSEDKTPGAGSVLISNREFLPRSQRPGVRHDG